MSAGMGRKAFVWAGRLSTPLTARAQYAHPSTPVVIGGGRHVRA
jgi:hypothetical protein